MEKYIIVKPILLAFLTLQDQEHILFEPDTGNTLECDGATIYINHNNVRHESTTTPNIIDVYLQSGCIKLVKQEG